MNRLWTPVAALSSAAGIVALSVLGAAPAGAHGYVNAPESRSYLCKTGANADCGAVQYEPQSMEYLKGFPAAGPADGQIASAGGQFGGKLDEQSPTRWAKTNITPGPMLFDWTYTAAHSTAKWHYYMTKQGWNQNAPLARESLQLLGEVRHDGSPASTNPDHYITIPSDRSGYHVILAVWDVADTVNAFYNVIDVNVTGGGAADTTAPTVPSGLRTVSSTPSAVTFAWNSSSDASASISYTVYRNGTRVGTTRDSQFVDSGLNPATSYSYRVVASDASGNESASSATLNAQTAAAPVADVTAPSAPTNLHTMGITATSADLMWGAATDNAGVTGYRVYRDGQLVRSVSGTTAMETGLTPGSTYRYTVRAIDAAGNESAASNTLTVVTLAAPTPTPTPTPTATSSTGTGNAAAGTLIAPYVDMGLYPAADLVAMKNATGMPAATLAFIVSQSGNACIPSWGGYPEYVVGGSGDFAGAISAFQRAGGRAIVSFGGASGTELAYTCTTPSSLTKAYRAVVDRYRVDRLDFDIEGSAVADAATNQRRAAAVAQLQRDLSAAGRPLEVSLTLPVMPYGLTPDGLRTVREFAAAGVKLASVNVMTMNYGAEYTQMGAHAVSAAQATASQLGSMSAYSSLTPAQLNALVGVTPMIGKNDVEPEVFTLADVSTLTRYTKANGIGMLAWWEVTRDKPCTGATVLYLCSGTNEPQWAYSRAFVNGAGGTVPAPLPTTTPKPTPTPTPTVGTGPAKATAQIKDDWGSGYCVDVKVTTTSTTPVRWSVPQPVAGTVGSVWNAVKSGSGTAVTFAGAAWNPTVSASSPTSFGYCATRAATPPATPTPSPTPTATVTPQPTPTPTPTQTPTASPTATPPASAAGVQVTVTVASDWGSGRQVNVVVRNTSGRSVNDWSVSLPWSGTSVSMWDAVGGVSGGVLKAGNASYNGSLAAGASVSFGFTEGGAFRAPTSCTATLGGVPAPCVIG